MTSRPSISPRIVNQTKLAVYLGKSKGWLSSNLKDLQSNGFPKKLDLVDGYDLRDVDLWIDGLKSDNVIKVDWKESRGRFR